MYRLLCFKLAVELAIPQLASVLLLHSLWLPYLLSGLALLATLPIVKAIPETLPSQGTSETNEGGQFFQLIRLQSLCRYRNLLRVRGVRLRLATAFL